MDLLLDPASWAPQRKLYRDRIRAITAPHRARQRNGQKHAVYDFLFTYYRLRPSRLEIWHPGPDAALIDPPLEYHNNPDYVVSLFQDQDTGQHRSLATANRNRLAKVLASLSSQIDILAQTSTRPARFTCFGMHEWAMVDGLSQAEVRHPYLPLRLSPTDITTTLDRVGVSCSHFDAYRFFTSNGATRQLSLTRNDVPNSEQPGCLHTNMDLYRTAYSFGPFLPGHILADCFELAVAVRILDMRASPYNVRQYGWQPIEMETSAGRAEYARAQRVLTERAAPLRQFLIAQAHDLGMRATSAETGL